jgi:uncharacterized protein involved in type VI secretion and phage assembly
VVFRRTVDGRLIKINIKRKKPADLTPAQALRLHAMSLLASNQSRYFFETPALAPDALQVVDFAGQEFLSQLFRFDLNLVSNDPEINFADVIQKPATLTMMRDDMPVKIHGLIADFEQGDYTADWVAYRARSCRARGCFRSITKAAFFIAKTLSQRFERRLSAHANLPLRLTRSSLCDTDGQYGCAHVSQ